MTRVIGILGRKQSGKGTAAQRLTRRHGYVEISLADPIREALLALDPWIYGTEMRLSDAIEWLGWDLAKEQIPEIRRLMQRMGTEVGRDIIGETVWTTIAHRHIEQLLNAGRRVVVPDVRFPNEMKMIGDLGGTLIRIERPDLPADTDGHSSEHAWRESVRNVTTVRNDGDIDQLNTRIDRIVNTHPAVGGSLRGKFAVRMNPDYDDSYLIDRSMIMNASST